MKLRYLVILVAGCVLLLAAGTAVAGDRQPTKLTLDSSVPVGNGYWVDSGRMLTKTLRCYIRPVRLVGYRSDGSTKVLDWSTNSYPGHAWATNSKRTGFERVVARVKKSKACQGAQVQVFPAAVAAP